MSEKSQVVEILRKAISPPFKATMGDGVGNVVVTGRPGYIWCRKLGRSEMLMQAYNRGAQNIEGIIVLVQESRIEHLGYEVVGYASGASPDDVYPPVPPHAWTHEWRPGIGRDRVTVYPRSWGYLRAEPVESGSMNVWVTPGWLYHDDEYIWYPGGYSPAFGAPAVATWYQTLYMDPSDRSLHILDGESGGYGYAVPPAPSGCMLPIAAIESTGTFGSVTENMIEDIRLFMDPIEDCGGLLPFGSCYGNHIAWVQANAVQNTWYNISDVDIADGPLDGVTHDGSGKLTVTEPGEYLILYSLCYEDDIAKDHLEVGIEVNGSGAAEEAGRTYSENKFANEMEHLGGGTILNLPDNATVELAIRTVDAGTPTITVIGMNLSLHHVEGGGGGGARAHNLLDGSVHPDTAAQAVTRGSLIVGEATLRWDELPIGAAARYLRSDGTDPAYTSIPADEVVNTPAGDIAATDVQAAIDELDAEKEPIGTALYTDYIHIRDEKPNNDSGGTFTQDAWQTRVLNTELDDTGGDAALAVNQITLEAGTYRCLISCPAWQVKRHKARLQNITDGTTILMGTNAMTWPGVLIMTRSLVVGRFTLAAQKVLEVQHRCQTTMALSGFGTTSNFGVIEVYTEVEFWKEA